MIAREAVASEGHVVVAALDQCSQWQREARTTQESQRNGLKDLQKTMSDLQDRDGLPTGMKAKSVAAEVAELERQVQLLSNCVKDRDQQIQTLRGKFDNLTNSANDMEKCIRDRDQIITSLQSENAAMRFKDHHRRDVEGELSARLNDIPAWVRRLFGA